MFRSINLIDVVKLSMKINVLISGLDYPSYLLEVDKEYLRKVFLIGRFHRYVHSFLTEMIKLKALYGKI